MTGVPYTLAETPEAGRLGLVVLQVDETIESDFRRLLPDNVTLHVSRVPSGAELTPETIAGMEHDLPAAVSLLPQAPEYDAVGYACTSGTTLLGADRVAGLIRANCKTRVVCNPLDAATDAFRHLGTPNIGLVSPYVASVSEPLARASETSGIAVRAALSFGEKIEANVARIDAPSIRAAAHEVAKTDGVEAVFLSCTNLRTLDILPDLEHELGLPVVSSNLALAWAMAGTLGEAPALRIASRLTR